MNDLEELAKRSADSARASVADLPIPPIPGRSVLKPVLRFGVIGSVLASLVLGLLILSGGGPTPTDVADAPATTSGGSPAAESTTYFELDVPDGWALSVSDETSYGPVDATFAYGTGTSSNPFSDADLMINAAPVAIGGDIGQSFRDDLTVRGHSAAHNEPADGVTQVSWFERDDLAIILSSRRYSLEDLVVIAEGLEIDGVEVTLPAPPDGMTLISSIGATEPDGTGTPVRWRLDLTNASSESALVQDGFVEMLLQAMPEGKGALPYLRHQLAESGTDVTVRGTPGVMTQARYDSSDGRLAGTVAWIEDGELFILNVSGPDDPVAIANSLRRIDRARFEELLAANPASNTPTTMSPSPTTSDPEGPPEPAVTIAVP